VSARRWPRGSAAGSFSESLSILQVITSTDRRGAEVFAVELDAALRAHGVRTRTVALVRGSSRAQVDVAPLGSRRFGLRTLAGLRAAARDADVVFAHGSATLPACALALLGSRRVFAYRNIGDPTYWSNSRAKRLRTRALLKRASVVIALTRATAGVFTESFGVPPDRIVVLPNAVSAARFKPPTALSREQARRALGIAGDRTVVLSLGALTREKSVGAAVAAVARMPDTTLVVAGDGPEREALELQASTLPAGSVVFTGATEDPRHLYAAADLLVLSSLSEGLAGVLVEAGLCGLPAVATDVGFVREIVIDGETGLVVDPGNVAALADAIGRARVDRERMGAAARRRCIEHFALEQQAEGWIDVARLVAARSSGRRGRNDVPSA
jgi:glycosyltransferase involved in cell wall biosynthesis